MLQQRRSSSRNCSGLADRRAFSLCPALARGRLRLLLPHQSQAAFRKRRSRIHWCRRPGRSFTPRSAAWSIFARSNNKLQGERCMFNPLKISEMLSQAGQMQEEVQRKLGETVVEASSGGGAVTATMNGKKELLKLRIDPSAVTSLSGGGQADVEMLQDLIVGAVNEAGRKAEEIIKSSLQGMLGGLKIPGLS